MPDEHGNYTRPVNFRKRYYRILAAAVIEKKGLHSLRHTFASSLVNGIKQEDGTIKSLTPRQVADLLGHSTSQITELYYVKKDTSRLHGIHRRLQPVTTMRQNAQKPAQKFCGSKEGKNNETHPKSSEKGETGCVSGCWREVQPVRTGGETQNPNQNAPHGHTTHEKGNRRKPSVFAGFLAGAEGLEPSATRVLEWMWESVPGSG